MMMTFLIVLIAVLALSCIIFLAKGQVASDKFVSNPSQHLRPVDVAAFRNLVDPAEEDFLRRNLRSSDFRKVQRQRLLAAAEYVSGTAHNAAVLLRLAEAARRSDRPATVESAEKIIADALRLRLYALHVVPRLYLAAALPGASFSPTRVAERYEVMVRQVVMLGLNYPTQNVVTAL